jgi:hypothetical protein
LHRKSQEIFTRLECSTRDHLLHRLPQVQGLEAISHWWAEYLLKSKAMRGVFLVLDRQLVRGVPFTPLRSLWELSVHCARGVLETSHAGILTEAVKGDLFHSFGVYFLIFSTRFECTF